MGDDLGELRTLAPRKFTRKSRNASTRATPNKGPDQHKGPAVTGWSFWVHIVRSTPLNEPSPDRIRPNETTGYAACSDWRIAEVIDGRETQRRVIRARTREGEDVAVVFQATSDGYVGICATGPALLDPMAVSKAVAHLRDLQGVALKGVRW